MPLMSLGVSLSGGDLPSDLQDSANKVLRAVDQSVTKIAQDEHLAPSQVRILRPCNVCTLVNDNTVFIIVSNIHAGGMPSYTYLDFSGKSFNLQAAITMVERDLFYEQAFGFTFSKHLLGAGDNEIEALAHSLAESYIEEEMVNFERLKRIVKIKPIFEGRDFMLNENLVFVLAPFEQPFNTIFIDHIKPAVESTAGLTCIRADNIYDNKPIIEDIWRNINEAHIIVSELTNRNPNVFYETGVAHTVGKEVILVTQNMDDVPFDLRHLRCIVYEYTPKGIKVLENNLRNTIDNIRRRM